MPFGNIGSAPNNNQKQLHNTIRELLLFIII